MSHAFRLPRLLFAFLLLGLTPLAGCDGAGGDDAEVEGRVRLLMTDAPLDNLTAAYVTIERIELVGGNAVEDEIDDNDVRIVLLDEPAEFDLIQLQNGVTVTLADVDIPAGDYRQLRLILAEDALLFTSDGGEYDLKVPSGAQTGIKILLPRFEIDQDGDDAEILIDFDASSSFHRAGDRYIMNPVIHPLYVKLNGTALDL